MFKKFLRAALLVALTALATASSASACPYRCTNLTATGIDSRVQIRFTTPIPMTAEGSYINTRPDFTGPAYRLHPATTGFVHNHVITTGPGLAPNTPYWYVIRLRDQAGRVYQDVINNAPFVTTLHRRLSVIMNPIQMNDDSDDMSAGDITMHARVGSSIWSYMWSNSSWSSGTSRGPREIVEVDGPVQTQFAVEAYDDDRTWGVAYGCGATQGPTWSNGRHSCGEWSTATQTIIPHRLTAASGVLPRMTSPGLPRFTVWSSYNLSYYR